jgi:hypothetical protein
LKNAKLTQVSYLWHVWIDVFELIYWDMWLYACKYGAWDYKIYSSLNVFIHITIGFNMICLIWTQNRFYEMLRVSSSLTKILGSIPDLSMQQH